LQHHKKCELCGEYKHLELHHIIPIVCGGDDEIDNWIAICTTCHTKLTPKSQLTKIGIRKRKEKNMVVDFVTNVYKRIDQDDSCNVIDICDILDNELHKICG